MPQLPYTFDKEKITLHSGEIFLKYWQPMDKMIRLGNGHEYVFKVKGTVSLCPVLPQHLDAVLAIRKACCGGSLRQEFRLAIEHDVRMWMGLEVRR